MQFFSVHPAALRKILEILVLYFVSAQAAPCKAKNPETIIKTAWQKIFEIALILKPFMPKTTEQILTGKIKKPLFPRV